MSEQPTETTAAPAAPVAPQQPTETTPEGTVAPESQQAEKPQEKAEESEAPAADANATTETPAKQEEPAAEKPAYLANNPALVQLFGRLPAILSSTGHEEMWGVSLKDSDDIPTVNVLIKFLRANEGNVKLAEEQLTKALEWRKLMKPVALAESGSYSASKFGGLGYLTVYKDAEGKETVTTWNIYGAVKDIPATFSNADEFIKWRVALMELAVKDLKLNEATSVIEYDGEDPYQMVQVHDYLGVSFFRLNPAVKAATKKTIDVFATAYPELLREKYFVNVPSIMGWMFAAMKVFLSKNTTRKFHPISNGANLAREFPSIVHQFPKVYGGESPELLETAKTVKLEADAETPEAPKEEVKEESAKEEPAKTEPAVTTAEAPAAAEVK
ncbi:hypothetical protein ASPWEDRAFT_43075 [Aspergillus wentii DTO 134E9]|uniref:Phosphatidylinositol transfer protein SFH5 n=1 Tax=Aspergillus wentii DTO 134E9 TaxID=1073089 RepID=A0A1L9RDN8_ASPWE|nr:uncharacterized protein ASPWEDRAFT_43075 [Aspergillus wentii DTO 134E9]KAI9933301.1 Non-classical phosphatidylinositol transfer protein (PITP) [Aspergillus wentii]OJJ33031.1 hypothetical protein ASPWEDRAFT_43075 [Aspergillus wentii DTO 134E9]